MNYKNPPIEGIFSSRDDLKETVIIALFISVGASLIASVFSDKLNYISGEISFLVGAGFVAAGCFYFVRRLKTAARFSIHLNPVIFLNKEGLPIDVPGYDFSEKFSMYLRGAFAENSALKKIWNKNSFYEDMENSSPKKTEAGRLADEAVEFFVIDTISTHFESYLNDNNIKSTKSTSINRENMPDIILQNRFADLFSTPMSEREAFNEHVDSPNHAEIVYSIGAGGLIFQRLDLKLPSDTQIKRNGHGQLEILSNKFSMKISCELTPFNTLSANDFEELYLGMNFSDVSVLKVEVSIQGSVRLSQVIFKKNDFYYLWIRALMSDIYSRMEFSQFLADISWPSVRATAMVLKKTVKN